MKNWILRIVDCMRFNNFYSLVDSHQIYAKSIVQGYIGLLRKWVNLEYFFRVKSLSWCEFWNLLLKCVCRRRNSIKSCLFFLLGFSESEEILPNNDCKHIQDWSDSFVYGNKFVIRHEPDRWFYNLDILYMVILIFISSDISIAT